MKKTIGKIAGTLLLALFISCGGSDKETPETPDKKTEDKKKDTNTKPVVATDTRKPPIINITDSVTFKAIVVYMKDSASTTDRISAKLAQIYGAKLAQVFKQNKIKMAGQPMAWYKSQKAPYFFEAGIPVNKKPGKLPKGAFVKEMTIDSAVIAHFYGPYDMVNQAYDAVKERMKDYRRKAKSPPFEIYVTDPIDKNGKMLDPYKVRTDIIFPYYGN